MDIWSIIQIVIAAALFASWMLRARLRGRFTPVSVGLSALLVFTCLTRWIIEGASVWTIALGGLSVILMAVTAFVERRPGGDARLP